LLTAFYLGIEIRTTDDTDGTDFIMKTKTKTKTNMKTYYAWLCMRNNQ